MAGFASFDGIEGESTDPQHEGWVNFHTLHWGVSQPRDTIGRSRRRGSVVVEGSDPPTVSLSYVGTPAEGTGTGMFVIALLLIALAVRSRVVARTTTAAGLVMAIE